MDSKDATQINQRLFEMNNLLTRMALAIERSNDIAYHALSHDQRTALGTSDVAKRTAQPTDRR